MIEKMTLDDVEGIMENIYPAYYAETNTYNKLTPSLDNARITIADYINRWSFVAKEDGKVVGIAVADAAHTFYEELEFDINMFYVHPDYRGTGVARALRDMLISESERIGAKVIYSGCLSGVSESNEQVYLNLWAKAGFVRLGTVMIRI
jgi:L-amino acid N-acyltransferase YncA